MSQLGLYSLLVLALASSNLAVVNHKMFQSDSPGVNGGTPCAACTIVMSLVYQLAEINNHTMVEAVEHFCANLSQPYNSACNMAAELLLPATIDMLANKMSPDDVCAGLNLCFTENGRPTCSLYPKSQKATTRKIWFHKIKTAQLLQRLGIIPHFSTEAWDICQVPGMNVLCKLYDTAYHKHRPAFDNDGDGHSTFKSLRGSNWRGKDCDDSRSDIRPGVKPRNDSWDKLDDTNCNGIYGINPSTLNGYEEDYCSKSEPRGVMVIGDSVGAHFHMPEEWFCPQMYSAEVMKDFIFAFENEFDWPQLSLVTGYMDSEWKVTKGPTDSIYKRLVERNRCNHRNYHNLGLNGDESFEVIDMIKTINGNPRNEYPYTVVLELVGNDVCNEYTDTMAHMTTVDEMRENMMKALDLLNASVPYDSKVLLVGMADAAFLYQFLHNRTHPLGRWKNDLTYSTVYDWWSCLEVTPCHGWLSSNDTLRALTSQRAQNLTKVLKTLAEEHKNTWKNLEINFMDCPIDNVIKRYIFEHGPDSGWQIIEPVDGFHPNQLGQALSAKEMWDYMELHLPHYLGPLNPHNVDITDKFGNQGGY